MDTVDAVAMAFGAEMLAARAELFGAAAVSSGLPSSPNMS